MSCVVVWPSTLTPSSGGSLPAAPGNRTWISQTQTGCADHYTTHTYVILTEIFSLELQFAETLLQKY